MSELETLARPYSEAVFKRAKETDSVQYWSEMLGFLAGVLSDETIKAASKNPRIEHDKFSGLLFDICQDQVNEEGKNFLRLLIENDRIPLISDIKTQYEAFRAEDEGYVVVDVLTAQAFPEEQKENFTASLEKAFNKKVRLAFQEDSELIGGVLVKAGDHVIDGSVRGQLDRLAKRLHS